MRWGLKWWSKRAVRNSVVSFSPARVLQRWSPNRFIFLVAPLEDRDRVEKMLDLGSVDLGFSPKSVLKEGKGIDLYWNLLFASVLLGTSPMISPTVPPGWAQAITWHITNIQTHLFNYAELKSLPSSGLFSHSVSKTPWKSSTISPKYIRQVTKFKSFQFFEI